jgi:hypothetical protein
MISVDSIQCHVTASFLKSQGEDDANIQDIKLDGAQAEGRWFGDGTLGIPFTEELTRTELNLLNELMLQVARRIYLKKTEENMTAPLV